MTREQIIHSLQTNLETASDQALIEVYNLMYMRKIEQVEPNTFQFTDKNA